jgi:hypothetical protein
MRVPVFVLQRCATVVDTMSSVGDPDLQDPHVFGPSGSISQRYGSGSGSGSSPFPIKEFSRVKYCNACKIRF